MTGHRRQRRVLQRRKFEVESLGERIAPAHLGVIAAGGQVHLNLIERLPSGRDRTVVSEPIKLSGRALDISRHGVPIIVTAPVDFHPPGEAELSKDTVIAKPPRITRPIIVTAPVSFTPLIHTETLPAVAAGTAHDNVSQTLLTIHDQFEQDPAVF
jgi:hypothetical protein